MFYLTIIRISSTDFIFPLVTDSPNCVIENIKKKSYSNAYIYSLDEVNITNSNSINAQIGEYLQSMQFPRATSEKIPFDFFAVNEFEMEQFKEWVLSLPFINEVNPDKFEIASDCMFNGELN